jgi:HK97 gp10 family phage protein
MRLGLELEGAEELRVALLTLSKAVRKRALYDVLRPAADVIRWRMGELAPRQAGVGGGGLADNIETSVARRIGSVAGGQWQAVDEFQAALAVGPAKHIYYAIFQEYGTVHHGAQPFGRPAFDTNTDVALGIIGKGLWALLEDATEKRGRFSED